MKRGYLWAAVYSFKRETAFRFNNVLSVFSAVVFVIITYFLWSAVYQSSDAFSAMTLQQTITYTVIISIINKVITGNAEMDIGDRVNTGAIGTELIRPLSFFWYLFFQKLGKIGFQFLFSSIPLFITAAVLCRITVLTTATQWACFLISLSLSVLLIYTFEFLIGLFSFLTAQIYGVSLLKQALVGVLAGMTIPLSFYPEAFRKICINLPFQAMYYIPSTIYLGIANEKSLLGEWLGRACGGSLFTTMMLEQAAWLLILGCLTVPVWKMVQKKLIIQGG